jgi:hypothetical protein
LLRRQFLGLCSAVPALSALSGCSQPLPQIQSVAPQPSAEDWLTLQQQLQGELLFSQHAEFQWRGRAANSRYDHKIPALIARPASSLDVQQLVRFISRFALPFAIRGGGHSYTGLSSTSGVLIDLGLLNQISLEQEIASIGAGATLGNVYAALGQWQRSIPAGSCAGVGIAGLVQGGGLGIADRLYGLTCDALLEAEIVTADGEIRRCNNSENSDLFWAVRGGGGGQFGILTALKMQTFASAPVRNYIGRYPLKDGELVLQEWQRWAAQLPDTVWTQLAIWVNGNSKKAPEIQIRCCGIGHQADVTTAWQQLENRLSSLWGEVDMQDHQYLDFMLSDCRGLDTNQCKLPTQHEAGQLKRVAMAGSSDMFYKAMDQAGCRTLLTALRRRASQNQTGAVLLTLMGGAIADKPGDFNAFAHRQALFSAQYLTIHPEHSPESLLAQSADWCHQMRYQMRRWSSGGAYLNYTDALMKHPAKAYYASHYARLQQIKRRYDPQSLFRQPQGIKV